MEKDVEKQFRDTMGDTDAFGGFFDKLNAQDSDVENKDPNHEA